MPASFASHGSTATWLQLTLPLPRQVEDFEEAERTLRRHGVEYSRFVLPGRWVDGAVLFVGSCVREAWVVRQPGAKQGPPITMRRCGHEAAVLL